MNWEGLMPGFQSIWGWDKDEILRLKQITGLAALFRDADFGSAWQPIEEEDG